MVDQTVSGFKEQLSKTQLDTTSETYDSLYRQLAARVPREGLIGISRIFDH